MKNLEDLYKQYLESRKESWSESTLRSEASRLRGVTEHHLQNPEELYKFLLETRKLKPYSLRTVFIRAGEFVDFLISHNEFAGQNKVKRFMDDKAKLFKYAYKKKEVGITFDEAAKRIKSIKNPGVRQKAKQLLYTGMRYTESTTLNEDSQVVGKGGWHRDVPMAKAIPIDQFNKSYATLYRELKKLGLTPHMLRKLCATKLVEAGAQEADLMKSMGWRTSQMASLYVQAQRQKQLEDTLTAHLKKEDEEDGEQVFRALPKAGSQ